MTNKETIHDLLTRGVEEVIDQKDLEKKLSSGKKLRVKLGIDPTSPNIHIGRAVVLRKLRAFQNAGHKAVLIVGDFTGVIGDTSDKDSERPMLSENQIKANMKTYFAQAFKILDAKKTETYYNSKWLKKLGFGEIGQLADLFSLHEFEAREVIARRMKAGKRVSLRELLYPLMQGYDSVAVKADLELGGTDQRFNLLAGRSIQPIYKQQPQNILMTSLMEGTDGRKMSSSWGNVINLMDAPKEMYDKVTKINDNLIEKYFLLATDLLMAEINKILSSMPARQQNRRLAFEITKLYHGEKLAQQAQNDYAKMASNQLPENIEIIKVKPGAYFLPQLLVLAGLASSGSEARRLVSQGGVKLKGAVVKDEKHEVTIKGKDNLVLQVGKRKIVKIV